MLIDGINANDAISARLFKNLLVLLAREGLRKSCSICEESFWQIRCWRIVPGLDSEAKFVYSDREGDLWVSDENAGLIRFTDPAVSMYTTSDGLPNNRIRTVLRSHDGTLWVGNNCGGISRFDGKRYGDPVRLHTGF